MREVTLFNIQYVFEENQFELTEVSDSKRHPCYFKDGQHFVHLNDHGTPVKTNYGLIVLYTNNAFFLPFEYWEKVKVGYLDNDPYNLSISNLYLVYPEEPIEHDTMEGFFYIPGYELNCINPKGIVYRITQSDIIFPIFEKNEKYSEQMYPHYRVNINNDLVSDRYVHRLLGLTFLNPPANYPRMSVDHKDHNKANFDLPNLEWVSVLENNVRAFKSNVRTDNKQIIMKDITTGEERIFFSQGQLSRTTGISSASLCGYISMGGVYKSRFLFKLKDDQRSWDEISKTKMFSWDLKAKNILTGDVIELNNAKEAMTLLGGSSTSIIRQVMDKRNSRRSFNGYEVKMKSDFSPWHEFSEYEKHIIENGLPFNTPVYEVTDTITNLVTIVYGVKSMMELTGVVKRTIVMVSKKSGMIGKRYKVKKIK